MATTQKKRTASKIASGTWTQIFPGTLDKQDQSLLFVKKLLAIGISNIMYIRAAFPESAFDNRNLDGLNLKILNKDSDCKEGRDLCKWISAAAEAIEKTYLREIILAIYVDPEKPEEAIETYTFQFEYLVSTEDVGEGGDVVNKVSVNLNLNDGVSQVDIIKDKDELYKRTIVLLRQIMQVTQQFDVLPNEAYMTLKLTYYDERTPSDYEPAGFNETDLEFNCDSEIEEPVSTVKVQTKHHALQVKIRQRDMTPGEKNIVTISSQPMSEEIGSQEMKRPEEADVVCQCLCPDDNDDNMLFCKKCGTRQHGACYLVFSADRLENQVCLDCAMESDPALCKETKLVKMRKKGKGTADTCRYRRSLAFCARQTHVGAKDIGNFLDVEKDVAKMIFNKLVEDGVVAKPGGKVDHNALRETVGPKYMGRENARVLTYSSPTVAEPLSPVSKLANDTRDLSMENNKNANELGQHVKRRKGSKVDESQCRI